MLSATNPFFRALPDHIKIALAPFVFLIELPRDTTVRSSDADVQVYFPETCVFSISAQIPKLPDVFVKFAGGAMLVGVGGLRGADTVRYEARVIGSGYAYAVSERHLLSAFYSNESLIAWQRQTALIAAEVALINASCRAIHTTAQRLVRTVLEAGDAFRPDRPITLTQAELARLLSVTRESVVGLLNQSRRTGALTYRRGQILVADRSQALELSCACYGAAQEVERRALQQWKAVKWREESDPFIPNRRADALRGRTPPRRST